MFITGANLSIPFFTIVLRKAYGLGAIAMAGGSWKTPYFSVAWPTGEFGGMGLEGSVKLGYRDELAAIEDADERRERYETMVARAYETGKALNYAANFAVDDTIDPADSRRWVVSLLRSSDAHLCAPARNARQLTPGSPSAPAFRTRMTGWADTSPRTADQSHDHATNRATPHVQSGRATLRSTVRRSASPTRSRNR